MTGEYLALFLALVTLMLWLSERFAVIVPVFLLVSGSFLLPHAPPIEPALGLFFCGMCLGLVLRHHRIDQVLAERAARISHGSLRLNLRVAMIITAITAMWTTNITAMAVCLPAFDGTIRQLARQNPLQAKGYLIALAMAANFGGMSTPIGTAPNAIAMAALKPILPLGFGQWILLMLPLSLILLICTEQLVSRIFQMRDARLPMDIAGLTESGKLHRGSLILFLSTIGLWITQSLHGLHPLSVGFLAAAIAFGTGILPKEALKDIDWDILLLIAGGILLGKLLEDYGWLQRGAGYLQSWNVSTDVQLGLLIALAAIGSALSSNTATAIVVVPLAVRLIPESYSVIAIAAACSLGVPFSISTPANALIAGRHGVSNRDLMRVGLPISIGGCLLVYFTVETVVGLFH